MREGERGEDTNRDDTDEEKLEGEDDNREHQYRNGQGDYDEEKKYLMIYLHGRC